jgi:hypothetical protein
MACGPQQECTGDDSKAPPLVLALFFCRREFFAAPSHNEQRSKNCPDSEEVNGVRDALHDIVFVRGQVCYQAHHDADLENEPCGDWRMRVATNDLSAVSHPHPNGEEGGYNCGTYKCDFSHRTLLLSDLRDFYCCRNFNTKNSLRQSSARGIAGTY